MIGIRFPACRWRTSVAKPHGEAGTKWLSDLDYMTQPVRPG